MDASFQRLRYYGPSRQRGSGLGTLALSVGRAAVPLLIKYGIPAAKRIGGDFLENIMPGIADAIEGKTTMKRAISTAAKKTARKQLGGGAQPSKRKESQRSKKSTTASTCKRKKTTTKTKPKKKRFISRENFLADSRSKNSSLFQNLY